MMCWICKKQPKFEGPVEVEVRYYFTDKRARDIDNYTPKFIMDGLVAAEIIEDDNQKIVKKLSTKLLYDKKCKRTEVTITKYEEAHKELY